MPIRIEPEQIVFEQVCTVEEALPLLEHLRDGKGGRINLKGCTHLHTALLQTLAAASPRPVLAPEDPSLARWVMPLIGGGDTT